MATRTRSRSTGGSGEGASAGWDGSRTGLFAAAAVAGAAVGIAANYGRKLVVQGLSASGDWADSLAAEHRLVLASFDRIEATGDEQTWIRGHTLTKIKNALGKHALEEENVIYPALRQHGDAAEADALNAEHGYVKTYLYELENMPKAGPAWLARVREFRTMLEEHMREEENDVFPALRARLSPEENAWLTAAVLREGMKLA